MNAQETLQLLRFINALNPAQKLDPDLAVTVWAGILAETPYQDAVQALKNLGRKPLQPSQTLWIQPGHILAEVQQIQNQRTRYLKPLEPPTHLADNPQAELEWIKTATRNRRLNPQNPQVVK